MNPQPTPQPPEPSEGALNPTAQILTNSILSQESGGDYDAVGDGGASHGGYQWNPGTWATEAGKVGINVPINDATPAQQNQVAYTTINNWLQNGNNPAQVASMWNAGQGEPNAYTGTFSNGSPSVVAGKYDVPAYVKSVLSSASQMYQKQQQPGIGQAAGALGNATGQALKQPGVAPLAIGAVGATALGGELLPEIAEGAEGLVGSAGNAIKGVLKDIGLGSGISGIQSIFGGSNNNSNTQTTSGSAAPSPEQSALSSAENSPLPTDAPEATKSPVYGTLSSMLSSTVGGQQVNQEAKARGVDPIAEMVSTGNIPQPDENGVLDKFAAIDGLQGLVQEDKGSQSQMLTQLSSPTNLDDLEKSSLDRVDKAMKDSHHMSATKDKVRKIFEEYRSQNKDGVVLPQQLQNLKDRVSEGDNWSLPFHEQEASQHVFSAMRGRLSDIAKQNDVKGWDELNKRMEGRLLAVKAIKKLPKKAARDTAKEFRKDVLAAIAGGLVAKTFGSNTLAGGIVGHLIESKLGKKEYKKLGSGIERAEAEKRRNSPQKGLLSLERKRMLSLPPGSPVGSPRNPHLMGRGLDKSGVLSIPAKKAAPVADLKTGRMKKVYLSSIS